jgi:hypothetical protein
MDGGTFPDYRDYTKTGKKKIPREKSVYPFNRYHLCSSPDIPFGS